jgi:hypothetical protein
MHASARNMTGDLFQFRMSAQVFSDTGAPVGLGIQIDKDKGRLWTNADIIWAGCFEIFFQIAVLRIGRPPLAQRGLFTRIFDLSPRRINRIHMEPDVVTVSLEYVNHRARVNIGGNREHPIKAPF